MSDFIDAIATIISFIAKLISGLICTFLLLVSIIDIFRWPEWFLSVSRSIGEGFWTYCRCGVFSFFVMWIDFLTIFPAALTCCTWRIVTVFKVFQKHFNKLEGDDFQWNPTIRGRLWLSFLLFLSDIPFIFLSIGTCFVPWRVPYLVHILFSGITASSGQNTNTRTKIFVNFILGFFDVATVFLGFFTIFSPIRLYMWIDKWRHYEWHFWPFELNHINVEPRLVMCVAGLLVIPDYFAYMGYLFALFFPWNWKACFMGHYLRARYSEVSFSRNSKEAFEEELALSPSYFLRGWLYVLIGVTDLVTVVAGIFVFCSWRSVRTYRQVTVHWAKLKQESEDRMTQKLRFATPGDGNPTPSAENFCDPEMHDASVETRLLILFQFFLLLTDLFFGFLALLTIIAIIRSYTLVRRLRKVAMKPIKGHNPRGWYYCNYRWTILVEFAKTIIFVLSLPLTLLLFITVYRVPVCYHDMKKVKAVWLAQQEQLRKDLAANYEIAKQKVEALKANSTTDNGDVEVKNPGGEAPIGFVPGTSPDQTVSTAQSHLHNVESNLDDKAIPFANQEETTPRTNPSANTGYNDFPLSENNMNGLRKPVYEIDEEEEERALFFEYALVFGTNVALIPIDFLFLPLLVFNILTVFRAHRQIREFIYVPKSELETPAAYRRMSILVNFIRVFREMFCTFFVWPFTLLCPPRFFMCVINLFKAIRPEADPLPAIRVCHWSWTYEQSFGWRLKIAGYVDPAGPHKELLNSHPSSIAINVKGDGFWQSFSNHYGGFKTGIIQSMLPMTFKNTDKQIKHVSPFAVSASSALSPNVPANYFVEVDCETQRVSKKLLKGLGKHVWMQTPIDLILTYKDGRSTLAHIVTTGSALEAADTAGASLDLTATDADFMHVSSSGNAHEAQDVTAEKWAPYACDVWWLITLTQGLQTLLDWFALFCFILSHVVPIRAFLLYRDLFVNATRKRSESALGYLKIFRKEYLTVNKGHMHLVESYEMHINKVHKRSIALDGHFPDYDYGNFYQSSEGDPYAQDAFNQIEKRSLGPELATYRQAAQRTLNGAALIAPEDICAMCATLFNNVLLVCGIVGDKFFDDMADLLAESEENDKVGRSKELRDKILLLNAAPQRTFLTAAPNAMLGLDDNETRAGKTAWDVKTVQTELLSAQLPPKAADNTVSKSYSIGDSLDILIRQHGVLGNKRYGSKAGSKPTKKKNNNASYYTDEDTETQMPYFEAPTFQILAERLAMTDDEFLALDEGTQSLMLTQAYDFEVKCYVEKYGHEPNERAFRNYQAMKKAETENTDESKNDRKAEEVCPVVETRQPHNKKSLPVAQIVQIYTEAQEKLLIDIQKATESYAKECNSMSFTKINYDYTEARLRCMYHASMVFVDVFTFIAMLIVSAPIYRIPTLISYIRRRNRFYGNHNWRWAILETFGEILLDILFVFLYAICLISVVEIVHVHLAMWRRWKSNPSYWGLREGIFDAIADLCSKFVEAIESIFRCSAIYYAMMTIICCIVAPVELATNHFGLSTAKCGCLRGWMVAMLGWLVLVIMPFVVSYKGTDDIESYTKLLYAYVAVIAAFIVLFLVVLIIRAPRRDQIQVSFAFVPLSGATVASFVYPILESAQLCALPIIVATTARRFDFSNDGFFFDNTWLSDAAHYLFLDHITRFHKDEAGTTIVDEPNSYPVGYYLSFSVAVVIFFFVSLPVVVDGLLSKRKNIAQNHLWRSIVFIGNVAALFVSRNLVAWLDCSDQSTFVAYTANTEFLGNNTNITTITNATYNPMQVGEQYLQFACWHQIDSSKITGAFTMLFMALFAVMVVLKGVRFAQQDEVEKGDDEIQAAFHEVADTYATILHVVLGTLSGLMYSKPLHYCIVQAVVLGLFVIIHIRNKPWIAPLFPVNSIATVWQLNTFRNGGYVTAVATSCICAAAISNASRDSDFIVSNGFPIALYIVWGAIAVLMFVLLSISLLCPKVTGDEGNIHRWELLLADTNALVDQLAREHRLIAWMRGGNRLSDLHRKIRNTASLQQYITMLIDIEGAVHVAAYNANFFNARRGWWSRAVILGGKGIREETVEEAEELLQSLKNGCLAPLPEEPEYDLTVPPSYEPEQQQPQQQANLIQSDKKAATSEAENKNNEIYSKLNSSREGGSFSQPVDEANRDDNSPKPSEGRSIAREPTAEFDDTAIPPNTKHEEPTESQKDQNAPSKPGIAEDFDDEFDSSL